MARIRLLLSQALCVSDRARVPRRHKRGHRCSAAAGNEPCRGSRYRLGFLVRHSPVFRRRAVTLQDQKGPACNRLPRCQHQIAHHHRQRQSLAMLALATLHDRGLLVITAVKRFANSVRFISSQGDRKPTTRDPVSYVFDLAKPRAVSGFASTAGVTACRGRGSRRDPAPANAPAGAISLASSRRAASIIKMMHQYSSK